MSWLWSQKTGAMYHNGALFAKGYAGRYAGKNNPDMQDVFQTGPLPCGNYTIGPAYKHDDLGPMTMNLDAEEWNEMFGREAFRIHGERVMGTPGLASKGCIVLNYAYRAAIDSAARGGDRLLTVVRDYNPQPKEEK